jgi:hypothetical protein
LKKNGADTTQVNGTTQVRGQVWARVLPLPDATITASVAVAL